MRTPDQIRERLQTRWDRTWTDWLGGQGDWPQTFTLDPPNEVLARLTWPLFTSWLADWPSEGSFGRVEREERRWHSLGQQDIPIRVHFDSAIDIANALGQQFASQYAIADARWRERSSAWPDLAEPLRRVAAWMAGLSQVEYQRFISVVDWLSLNRTSGLYIRQLPIAGIHSKWVEANRGPLSLLMAVRLGKSSSLSFADLVGLKSAPTLRRIRLLDPVLRNQVGGLSDVMIPLADLADLALPVRVVLVVENQQTALACGELPGTVLIMGGGFAVTELASVRWLNNVPVVYWGDIDAAGFGILNAFRANFPHVESFLMGEEALHAHQEFWTEDPKQEFRTLPNLSPGEDAIYRRLASGQLGPTVRLEQERIEWQWAWAKLRELIDSISPRT
jgi:hypothetical protein